MHAYFKILFGGLVIAGLAGCKNENPPAAADPIDLSAQDSSVRPQDDFFSYANGAWIKRTEIPSTQQSWGTFAQLGEQNLKNLNNIMDSLSKVSSLQHGSAEQRVADLYASIMDSAGIEARGLTPLKEDLTRIGGISGVNGLLDEVVRQDSEGDDVLFAFGSGADDKNSRMTVAHFYQGGLGLPNRDYYFKQDSSIVHIKNAYEAYVAKIFTLIGDDSALAAKEASGVLTAETELAKVSKSPVEMRDPVANYHKLTVPGLNKLTPGLKWSDLLAKLQVHQDTVLVGQPEFYAGMYKALNSLPLEDWKNYLRLRLVDKYGSVLDHRFVDARFAYTRLLSGQREQTPRWKRASQMVDRNLGDALGQLYVKQYFPPEAKQRMQELVDNLIATYGDHIRNLDWMSDSTKQKALAKLHAIARKIGYPDKWKDYASVDIVRDNAVANLRSCGRYEYKRDVDKIGKPVDRSEWFMTPPTVNAYYDPTENNINFPAGILQPPFFFKDGDDAVNYGAIGLVIGHEMTHGFDDQGRQFDGDGNLKNWWSPEDLARFKQKTNLVVRQYDSYVAVDTFHLNGNLTLGENLADVGGLSIAYGAFKKTAQGKDTTRIDGLTPDQRFFLSFAQVWRAKYRPQALMTQVLTNPHSIPQWRVNGPTSDLNAFYDTYHIQPTDKMYLPDSLRAHIW
jgi:putative endopeptidase